jgi:hypothetical protein
VASIERGWHRVLRWPGSGERIGDANLILGRLERLRWWQAVSTDFAAMATSASCARCVLGERKRLACETEIVAWCARLTKGISPRALHVPAPSSDFHLGEAEEGGQRRGMMGLFHSSVRQEEMDGVLARPPRRCWPRRLRGRG